MRKNRTAENFLRRVYLNVNDLLKRNIARLRAKSGVSQNALAEKLGISPQAISKWERGICCPDISLLPRIAKVFGTSIDELFSEK